MKEYLGQTFTGERALYQTHKAKIVSCVFRDGESPLKESSDLNLSHVTFEWKYPLWYDKNVTVVDAVFRAGARAGIWYTRNISFEDVVFECPKALRRAKNVKLLNVKFMDAKETLWWCDGVDIDNALVVGDYFAMNCSNLTIDHLTLEGNYGFDGAKNLRIKNSVLHTKDAFWNCENVVVEDSTIVGEYFGWNSKNVTLIGCEVESLQGFCYMENLKMIGCKLKNTTLAFEYSTVDAEILSEIDSVKNPKAGRIASYGIHELIWGDSTVDPNDTKFEVIKP